MRTLTKMMRSTYCSLACTAGATLLLDINFTRHMSMCVCTRSKQK